MSSSHPFAGASPSNLKEQTLTGGGDLGARMRQIDWSKTPLGPVESWPQSLRTCVRILLTSRQPMFVWWGEQLINLYNDAYCSILGGKHPWALGKPASEVWREIWDEVEPRASTAMNTKEGTYDEALLLIMERNGYPEETYYTFSYSPVPNDQGETGGIICANTDDTERIISERQVRTLRELASRSGNARTSREASELSVAALTDNNRDVLFALIYLIDAEKKSASLVSAAGLSPARDDIPKQIAITDSSVWHFEETLESQGTHRIIDLPQMSALPTGAWEVPSSRAAVLPLVGSGETNQGGFLVIGLNPFRIVDEKYLGFLTLAASQVSASIAHAQSYEEEKKRAAALAELDRAKTAFFSNISHELRTPLTLMLGPIEDSLEEKRDSNDRERLDLLHRNALRLLKLVNTLLDFSRIEAGRVQANYEPLDLAALTTDLASVFRSAVERAGLRLVLDVEEVDQPVYVDREMWEKIVLNLLSNALKSTFEGEIRVTLRSRGNGILCEVSDTGTGIPDKEIPHLFERFRRVEGAKRRTHEGSGIGLALVNELVQMHGGTIGVESELGKGSTFRIFLPFGSAHLPQERIRNVRSNPASLAGATAYVQEAMSWIAGGSSLDSMVGNADVESIHAIPTASAVLGGRVLLVDDNRDMREYVQRLLSRRFEVTTANNGREALTQATANPPDLVLSDVMMPEMDGFELLAALRAHPDTRTIPVVLLSARAGEESRIEGLQAGADDYLVKPFTARELLARVEAHISMARFRREALAHEAELQQELEIAQRMAAEAVEQISDGFWMYDSEFRIAYMNSAAEAMSRRSRVEQIGQTIFELFPELRGSETELHFRRAAKERVALEFETYYQPWKRWFVHRVYPAPGGGVVDYCRDVTDQRKTEQALRSAEQLAAAGRLAASISHEINNPLEAVTNLLYLAKSDSSLNENVKGLLEIADKELQRLSHIASKSLKFYKQSSKPTAVYLGEILDSVLFFYETRLKDARVTIEKRFEPTPAVICYAGEMQQVFTNLISNALDAMPEGGRLVLAIHRAPNGMQPGVQVTVADTGMGMKPETRKNLFQPFYTTKGESGTGLGLWVSAGILQKHGARIRVRSGAGKGTVFSMFVPHVMKEEVRPLTATDFVA